MTDTPPAIPIGVYYSIQASNFYNAFTSNSMGIPFYKQWRDRWRDFPCSAEIARRGQR